MDELCDAKTYYKGRRFHHKLEAQWAVFFDTLEILYQYEPKGIDIGGSWYFPSFYLPEQRSYIDIKELFPSKEDERKVARFTPNSGASLFIFWGQVRQPSLEDLFFEQRGEKCEYGSALYGAKTPVRGCCWIECPYCRKFDIALFGCLFLHFMRGCEYQSAVNNVNRDSAALHYISHYENWDMLRIFSLPASPRLIAAYEAANSAEFAGEKKPE